MLSEKLKKALPWILVGLGAVVLALVFLKSRSATPATTGGALVMAPLADARYGTPTDSGIPAYDQYQNEYPPTVSVQAIVADPSQLGLTYTNSLPGIPVSIIRDGQNQWQACPDSGCTDPSAANYQPNAQCSQIGSCVRKTYGCLKRDNPSYNPFANTHDERLCTTLITADAQIRRPAAGASDSGACILGAQVSGLDSTTTSPFRDQQQGCYAPMTDPLLGGFRGCGDAWDMTNPSNSLGATLQ